ncbi:ABC transporter substrate-binding protein [Antricoccus suffuscus]|nr:ABC transporter substrate-binding protein [Antricoccus suffuscus]
MGARMVHDFNRRQFLSVGAGFLLVSGVAVACGGTAAPNASSGTGSEVSGRTTKTPKKGGTLKMGLESDFNSFAPPTGQFDTAGLMYASTVFDPLMALDANGDAQPYLCKSMTPNADFTEFTVKLRDGIMFHDNTPLTSAEVVGALQAVQKAPLTAPALLNLASVTATDAMTVVMKTKTPWPAFPTYLTGQLGYVPSPKTIATPAGGLTPIGTGPFVFDEWVPGSHFYANANKNYWQKGLPYVDRVEYQTISDPTSRENSLLAGTIDIMHSSDSINLRDLKDKSEVQYLTDKGSTTGEPSMNMVMINLMAPVVSDLRIRQAISYGFDNATYQKVHNFGLYEPAYGLFPGNKDYDASAKGFPRYDQGKAKSLVQEYTKEKGKPVIEYATTNNPRNGETAQFVQQQWEAIGITVKIKQVEQVQLITNAVLGDYQTTGWRSFNAANPDANYVWWSPLTAAPIGKSALNFARNMDPEVETALQKGRTSLNKADRLAAYQKVNERFAVDLPYLFTSRTIWGCFAAKKVQNFNGQNLPDGKKALSFAGGLFYPTSTWLNA